MLEWPSTISLRMFLHHEIEKLIKIVFQVAITCGVENALVAVSEPNKCEYRFEFNTPSACRVSEAEQDHTHDEL